MGSKILCRDTGMTARKTPSLGGMNADGQEAVAAVVDFGSAPTKARAKVSTGSESATSALTAEADGVEWPANVLRLTCAADRARRAKKRVAY